MTEDFIGLRYVIIKGELYLERKLPNGKIHYEKPKFNPYCFVRSSSGEYKGLLDGKKYEKKEFQFPHEVKMYADYRKETTAEADIPFARRYTTDLGLSISKNALIASVDIEADDSRGFPTPEKDEILSIAIVKSNGEEIWCGDASEQEILTCFINNVQDVAIIFGWNSGVYWSPLSRRGKKCYRTPGFDFPFLYIRALEYGIDLEKVLWWIGLGDLYPEYREMRKGLIGGYSLKNVAQIELGHTKLERKGLVSELSTTELMDYNLTDARLVMELEKKYHIMDVWLEKMRLSYQPIVTDGTTRVVDSLMLRKAREMGYVLPNVAKKPKVSYPGAMVLEPKPGIYEGVAVYDVNSLYPNVMLHRRFGSKERYELIKAVVGELLDLRFHYKDLYKQTGDPNAYVKQYAYKILANSTYGYFGTNGSRLYDPRYASFITSEARKILTKIKEFVEVLGYKTLYGDTDSIMIQVPRERALDMARLINTEIYPFSVKLDKYFTRLMFVGNEDRGTRKKYAGLLDNEELEVVGFGIVRSDRFELQKMFQRELIERILHGMTPQEAIEFLREWKKKLYSTKDLSLLTITMTYDPAKNYSESSVVYRIATKLKELGYNPDYTRQVSFVWIKEGRGRKAVSKAYPYVEGIEIPYPIDYDHYYALLENTFDRTAGVLGVRAYEAKNHKLTAFI